ncbi:MAG: acetate--CoA ligase [Pseudomonadota bacterium]
MNIYPVPGHIKQSAWIDSKQYTEMYKRSIENPESFWSQQGQCIDWIKPFTKVMDTSFDPKNLHIKWFYDGTLNACANCLDRHLANRKNQTAILWVGDNPDEERQISYGELHTKVCRFANALKDIGVRKRDRVAIYLPMIPEAVITMLACARIGAVHSVVFGGFSAEALSNRILDCDAAILVTANEGYRHGKLVPFKRNADKAAAITKIEKMVVIQRTENQVPWDKSRDYWYHDLVRTASENCECEALEAEHPLFILYTSGSTGTPKGVLHTTGGYMVYATLSFKYIFDYKDKEIYWCTADIGWITGHTYLVYGPLAAGATIVMFEGVPDYPNASRYWNIVEKYNVNILYTAPTVIRGLMRYGSKPVKRHNLDSLRILGTVGEPIDPKSWDWYHSIVGGGHCPIVDTWWQTETGGIMLTPLPGSTDLKPGSVSRPFFGIKPALVDDQGHFLQGPANGNLVICNSWPGQMRTVFRNHARFVQTYFSQCPGSFFTDDQAHRDENGDYWITGRIDDVIKVSGHRIGTARIESAIIAHPKVAEAAAVGYPHDIKGQGLYLFVRLNQGEQPTSSLHQELINWVREKIGPIATPDFLQFVKGLPKTRSGKVMRRILRKIAANDYEDLGDISTLADPSVIEGLISVIQKSETRSQKSEVSKSAPR